MVVIKVVVNDSKVETLEGVVVEPGTGGMMVVVVVIRQVLFFLQSPTTIPVLSQMAA